MIDSEILVTPAFTFSRITPAFFSSSSEALVVVLKIASLIPLIVPVIFPPIYECAIPLATEVACWVLTFLIFAMAF